jgi:hypothetical protein
MIKRTAAVAAPAAGTAVIPVAGTAVVLAADDHIAGAAVTATEIRVGRVFRMEKIFAPKRCKNFLHIYIIGKSWVGR